MSTFAAEVREHEVGVIGMRSEEERLLIAQLDLWSATTTIILRYACHALPIDFVTRPDSGVLKKEKSRLEEPCRAAMAQWIHGRRTTMFVVSLTYPQNALLQLPCLAINQFPTGLFCVFF